jgi:hypothetical protein
MQLGVKVTKFGEKMEKDAPLSNLSGKNYLMFIYKENFGKLLQRVSQNRNLLSNELEYQILPKFENLLKDFKVFLFLILEKRRTVSGFKKPTR